MGLIQFHDNGALIKCNVKGGKFVFVPGERLFFDRVRGDGVVVCIIEWQYIESLLSLRSWRYFRNV